MTDRGDDDEKGNLQCGQEEEYLIRTVSNHLRSQIFQLSRLLLTAVNAKLRYFKSDFDIKFEIERP